MVFRGGLEDENVFMETGHSRLFGLLAAHWGNETFARRERYAS